MENRSVKRDVEQRRESETVEIDLIRLWNAVWKKIWVVILSVILCGGIAAAGSVFMIAPEYQASALLYVNNNAPSSNNPALGMTYADLTAAKSLVDSYLVILNSRGTLEDVIAHTGVDRTYGELRGMLASSAVNETEIFQVVVTSTDPEEAEKIANGIAEVLPQRIASIIDGTSTKVVDYAIVPSAASSPSHVKNTILGILVGFILSVGVIVLVELFDITLKEEEDIKRCSNYPILAYVTNMERNGMGNYYKRYYRRYETSAAAAQSSAIIGNDISFAASEAYKLLRTKIQYSFADDQKCRVIAVSSSMVGEGKSVSSVNLSNTLAQFGERVLLIDCDLRRPTVAEKLSLNKTPGLSEYLTGNMDINDLFQQYSSDEMDKQFYVVTAGACPPNPVELLNSAKMAELIKSLRGLFDYVIMDMPPVGDVSDALVAAKIADGVLMVVRQNYCNSVVFKDALRQFEFVNSRILGIVVNYADNKVKSKYRDSHYAQASKNNAIKHRAKQNGNGTPAGEKK